MESGKKSVFLFMVPVVLSVFVVTMPAAAGSVYLGAGIQSNTLRGDLKAGSTGNHDSAMGANAIIGLRLSRKLAFDVVYGTSKHDETTAGTESTLTWIEAGPKFFYNTDSRIQPYLTIGGGTYKIEINNVEYEGPGGFVGAGIEEQGGRSHVVGIYVRASFWSDDSPNLSASTLSGGLNYNYYFGGF